MIMIRLPGQTVGVVACRPGLARAYFGVMHRRTSSQGAPRFTDRANGKDGTGARARWFSAAAAAGATCAALAASGLSTTECEATPAPGDVQSRNQLWPAGISNDVVNKYVDEILANDKINIKSLPDSIERLIYATTVRVTLNAVYRWLSVLHGIKLFGHHLELVRELSPQHGAAGLDFEHNSGVVHDEALEEITDRLLRNTHVNQWWIPDVVERQVYRNCLKLIFCLIDKIADSLSVRLCGHELSLSFEPMSKQRAVEIAGRVQQRETTGTSVDSATLEALVVEAIRTSSEGGNGSALLYLPLYHGLVVGVHKTLYGLILGIVDDILVNTELVVLQEKIRILLVPDNPAPATTQAIPAPSPRPDAAAAFAARPPSPPPSEEEMQRLRKQVAGLEHQLEASKRQVILARVALVAAGALISLAASFR